MPTFDLQSTLLLVALLSLVQTGIMAFTYCVSSYEHGVGQWVLANAAFAGSCIMLLLRGPIPEELSIAATNFFLLLGAVLLLDGIARFLRTPVRHLGWIYFSAIALMAPIAAFTFIWPDLTMRIVIVSLAVAAILVPCIWLLVCRAPPEITAAARFTTFAITLVAVVSLVRGIGVALQPVNGIFQSNLSQEIGFVGALIGASLWTAGMAGMVVQRLLARHQAELANRLQAEQALQASEACARRQVQALEALSATLTAVTAERELEPLLELIVGRVADLLALDIAELLIYDEEHGDLVMAAHFPPAPEQVGYRQQLDEGAMGLVARTRRSLILNDYPAWPGALPDTTTMGLVAILDVPLLQGDELVGVLGGGVTQRGRSFNADDERLLTLFAQQATVALQNARLNVRLLTDPLTGLHNRGRFFALAEHLVCTTRMGGQPLGAAILDVDYFKRVNDTYGHSVGDDVLRWVAGQCIELLPPEAVVGRIGGEEFAMLIAGADMTAMMEAVETLRRHIAQTAAPTRQGELAITISVGVAVLDEQCRVTIDRVLECADRALYRAKQAGRNRVCGVTFCRESDEAETLPVIVWPRFREVDREV